MARRRWPLAPIKSSPACWFYLGARGLEVYIEQRDADPKKPRNALIPWRDVFSAVAHYRRSRRKPTE